MSKSMEYSKKSPFWQDGPPNLGGHLHFPGERQLPPFSQGGLQTAKIVTKMRFKDFNLGKIFFSLQENKNI